MKTLYLIAAASLLSLAACNSKPSTPEVLDTNPDPMATQLANAAPVELPPSIKADKTMRCKDNSLVYVTFFDGEKQAVVRTEKNGTPTTLKAPASGDAYVADGGWKMSGNPTSITIERPGKGSTSCHT